MLLIIIFLTFSSLAKVVESFDLNKIHIDTLANNNEYDVILNNYDDVISYEDIFFNDTLDIYDNKIEISEEIFNYAQDKTNLKWYKEFTFVMDGQSARFEFPKNNVDDVLYYQSILPVSFVSLEDSDTISNLIGSLPTLDDEVVISSYVADNIINGGIYLDDENKTIYKPQNYEQIILEGKYIKISVLNKGVKIVGIIENDLTKISELKDINFDMMMESDDDAMVYDYFLSSLDEYSRVFVTKDFMNKLDLGENNIAFNTSKVIMDDNYYMVPQLGYINGKIEVFDGNDIVNFNSLMDNEVIIDINLLNDITNNDYQNKLEGYFDDDVLMFTKDYIKNNDIINRVIKIDLNGNLGEYVIKGVSLESNITSRIYYAKDMVSGFISKNIGVYSIFTKAKTRDDLRKIFEVFPIDNASTLTKTKYSSMVLDIEIIVYKIKLFGEASILFLILGILLLCSVLKDNMNYWIKGLRKLVLSGYVFGVFNMFIMQYFSLVIICLLFTSIGINIVISLFNNYINTMLIGSDIKLLVYGFNTFIWLAGTAIGTICLGYALSTCILLRKKKKGLIKM